MLSHKEGELYTCRREGTLLDISVAQQVLECAVQHELSKV